MSVVDKLRSFAESREAPDVVCCGLTYRDIREAHATIADLRDQNERMRRLLDYVQQTAPGVLVAAHVNAGKP